MEITGVNLGEVVIQAKKSPHKFILFRHESISKFPGGMALFEGTNFGIF